MAASNTLTASFIVLNDDHSDSGGDDVDKINIRADDVNVSNTSVHTHFF